MVAAARILPAINVFQQCSEHVLSTALMSVVIVVSIGDFRRMEAAVTRQPHSGLRLPSVPATLLVPPPGMARPGTRRRRLEVPHLAAQLQLPFQVHLLRLRLPFKVPCVIFRLPLSQKACRLGCTVKHI